MASREGRRRRVSQEASDIERVRTSTRGMKNARAQADEEAKATIARVEKSLHEALDGETLRGLPELGGRVFGLRIEVEGSSFARLPRNRRVLILDAKGQLRAAILFPEGAHIESPDDREVVASVLDAYLRTVQRGIALHLQSASRRTETFERVAALSRKLATVLG